MIHVDGETCWLVFNKDRSIRLDDKEIEHKDNLAEIPIGDVVIKGNLRQMQLIFISQLDLNNEVIVIIDNSFLREQWVSPLDNSDNMLLVLTEWWIH